MHINKWVNFWKKLHLNSISLDSVGFAIHFPHSKNFQDIFAVSVRNHWGYSRIRQYRVKITVIQHRMKIICRWNYRIDLGNTNSFDQRKHTWGSFWPPTDIWYLCQYFENDLHFHTYVCRTLFERSLKEYFGERLFVLKQSSAESWNEMLRIVDHKNWKFW